MLIEVSAKIRFTQIIDLLNKEIVHGFRCLAPDHFRERDVRVLKAAASTIQEVLKKKEPTMNKETPEYIMEAMRRRTGLNASDTSEDEKLLALSPREKLYKVCGWYFGDPSWVDNFLRWANDCGFEIREANHE